MDTPRSGKTVVEESSSASDGDGVGGYLDVMKRQDRFQVKA